MKGSAPVLVCTVGGSHAPIVTAIHTHRPSFVWFVCTEGKAGSVQQIRGKGSCIKKSPDDKTPTLPNIPTQCNLPEDQYSVLIVPADDPDAIHGKLRELFDRLRSEIPRRRIIADYTGGTKSMTAALLLAGLEYEDDVELYMVVGQRDNLVRVTDGTEIPAPANVERIRFGHKFRVALAPWSYFGYAEAAVSLETVQRPHNPEDRLRYLNALAASRAFAAWDRFEHARARELLTSVGHTFGSYLSSLAAINHADEKRATPARLVDLYLNVQRRAERGQFDDAVARAYRLLEWTAQWLLSRDANISSTSNISLERVPEGVVLPQNDKGQYVAGLRNAWRLLETLGGSDEVRGFARKQSNEMRTLLMSRNNSILAHGFQPIAEAQWQQWKSWLESSLCPFLLKEAERNNVRGRAFHQLPREFPSDLVCTPSSE